MQNKFTETQISALDAEKVFAVLESGENGLSEDEAKRRSVAYGANKLPEKKTFHPLLVLGKQFVSPMALLLLSAGVLALIAKMPELAIAVWAVVLINGLFSFLQEWRTDRALTLLGKMIPRNVRVVRSGVEETIPASGLTIGDLLVVTQGEVISADARLVETNELFVDNSVISGESVPLSRLPGAFVDRERSLSEINNLLFAGSTVAAGSGKALVYAIGADTEVGQVSGLATKIDVGRGTLGIQISKVVRAITLLAFAMGILVFVLSLLWIHLDWITSFLFALAIVTANIPEGLLPTVNLCLAMGAQRMAKHNALIRGLSSVETLSSATIICTDKTGTLTKNQLMVRAIWTPDNLVEITGEGYQRDGSLKIASEATRKGVEKLLAAAVLCNEASLSYDGEKREFIVNGSPTEGCLLIAAEKFGYSVPRLRSSFAILERHPFDSNRKKMSVLLRNDSCSVYDLGAKYLFAKGAPSVLIPSCGVQYKGSHVVALSVEDKNEILEQNDRFANEGFRVLAFAYKKIETDSYEESDMVFLGLAVTYDPPREDVRPAIEQCRKAGLKVTIITGDYGLTAAAIGRQVGIIEGQNYRLVKGSELAAMGDPELVETLRSEIPLVFSRTTPQDKLRIVEGYKSIGEVVAVTGDGINDVLALRSANMGIAMGKNGTDVARGAADTILLDDHFSTIVEAIEEGRGIYANIKKFITYILVSNVPELIPTLFVVFLHVPAALTVLQILSVDLGTDLVPALALGAEEPDANLLSERPRKASDHLIDARLIGRSYAYLGIVESGLTMGAFFYVWFVKFGYSLAELQSVADPIAQGAYSDADPIMGDYRYATTFALASIVFAQIGNLFACRSDEDYFFRSFRKKNPFLYLGIAVELAIIGLIVYAPFLNGIFRTSPLDWSDVALLLVCPVVVLLFDTLWKALKHDRRAKARG